MLTLKHKQPEPEASPKKAKLRLRVLFSDLSLLIALMAARLMVRQTLRRRRQERAARLKQFKLIPGRNIPERKGITSYTELQ